jgi:putative transposase
MYPHLKTIYVDGGFAGKPLQQWAKEEGYNIEVIKRIAPGFKILPKRWIVERTFGWFNRYRRLAKDHEFKVQNSEHMIDLAFIHLMIRKLIPKLTF